MIQTTIRLEKPEIQKHSFPLLARSVGNSMIVLFTSEMCGVVISGSTHYPIGYSSLGWLSLFDRNVWEIFPKGTKIVLEQQ